MADFTIPDTETTPDPNIGDFLAIFPSNQSDNRIFTTTIENLLESIPDGTIAFSMLENAVRNAIAGFGVGGTLPVEAVEGQMFLLNADNGNLSNAVDTDGSTAKTSGVEFDLFRYNADSNWQYVGFIGQDNTIFIPSQANLYAHVASILDVTGNLSITEDADNNTITIGYTTPNLFTNLVEILRVGGALSINGDSDNNTITITGTSPTKSTPADAINRTNDTRYLTPFGTGQMTQHALNAPTYLINIPSSATNIDGDTDVGAEEHFSVSNLGEPSGSAVLVRQGAFAFPDDSGDVALDFNASGTRFLLVYDSGTYRIYNIVNNAWSEITWSASGSPIGISGVVNHPFGCDEGGWSIIDPSGFSWSDTFDGTPWIGIVKTEEFNDRVVIYQPDVEGGDIRLKRLDARFRYEDHSDYMIKRIGTKDINVALADIFYVTDIDASDYLNENYLLGFNVYDTGEKGSLEWVLGTHIADITASSATITKSSVNSVSIDAGFGTFYIGRETSNELLLAASTTSDNPMPLSVYVQRVRN